jgi:S-adenosylmethionine uptake transporter
MPAPLLIACASLLFAVMGLCVKLASPLYGAGEIVFYRSLIGMALVAAAVHLRGGTLRTRVPGMHFWRSASGVFALCLWFYAIGHLPLATAMTLNYTSSVWMALFLIGGAVLFGAKSVDGRLVAAVLAGFVGVALVLRPTIAQQQLWHGLAGLGSGLLASLAYLQVSALGRAGEPEPRIVFYFSLGGAVAGGSLMVVAGGPSPHTLYGVLLLLAIGVLALVAQLMMTRAYSIGRTLSNAALQYLGIVFSFGFGVWLFGDPVTPEALVGMLLIVAAGLAATRLAGREKLPTAIHPTEP